MAGLWLYFLRCNFNEWQYCKEDKCENEVAFYNSIDSYLGSVVTILATVLVNVGMTLHVGIQHALIDTSVRAIGALERLSPKMVT